MGVSSHPTFSLTEHRRTVARRRRVPARGWLVRRMLLAADVLGLVLAFILTQEVVAPQLDPTATPGREYLLLLTFPLWIVLAKLYGLYDRDEERAAHSTVDDLVGVFHLVTVGAWLAYCGLWSSGVATPALPKFVIFWALAILLVATCRSIARAICRRHPAYVQNVVIVGAGDVGQHVAHKLLNHREYGINLLGFVDHSPKDLRHELDGLEILGSPSELAVIVAERHVERVIIAFSLDGHDETLSLIRQLRHIDVQIDIVPRMFEIVGTRLDMHAVEGIPLLGLPPSRLSRSSRLMKRAMDVAIASLGVLVVAPLLAVIAVLIRLDSRGPVIFRQQRVGAGDASFAIFKFRTMCVDAEAAKEDIAHLNMHLDGDPRMFKVPNDPRITRVGRILRRYSLDELPQLFNVIKGDMSLVGPRPLIADEDCWVTDWARRRLELRPGVTGLWQVLGASDIPFEEMTKLDYLYITNWTLWGDLRLLVQTVPALLRTKHAY